MQSLFSYAIFLYICMGIWRNGNASDFGSEDCRFDPCYARLFVIFFYYYCTHSFLSFFLSLNGNVAQSVERKSHNLKVVSSILTVPTFFPHLYCYSSLLFYFFITVWAYGAMETHQTSDLRIAGSTPAMLVFLLCFF